MYNKTQAADALNCSRIKIKCLMQEAGIDLRKNLTDEEFDIIKNLMYTNAKNKENKKLTDTGFEVCGENEFYAKILTEDGELFGVGTYSSTNLNEDVARLKNRRLHLKVIDESEAKEIFMELYRKESFN